MTGPGTNSYLVGAHNDWSIIDPGPVDDRHMQALLAAAGGKVRQILVTHTHEDHSPGATPLKSAAAAPLLGQTTSHRHWQDPTFSPDRELHHGDRVIAGGGATLRPSTRPATPATISASSWRKSGFSSRATTSCRARPRSSILPTAT